MTRPPQKPLPPGWKRVPLGEVIVRAQPGFACGERSDKGVIQLRMNNVATDGNFNWQEVTRIPDDFRDMSGYWLQPGDVLFNNTNSVELVGKSALFKGYAEGVVFSNHFSRLVPDQERLHPGFLAKWLLAMWSNGTFAHQCNRWIGQAAMPRNKLLTLEIPLPPLVEQRRIVARLERQMALVEQARAAAEEMYQNISSLKAAFLREIPALGGNFPQRWSWVALGEVCRVYAGGSAPQGKEFFADSGPYFFRVSDLGQHRRTMALSESRDKLSAKALASCHLVPAKQGTVLFPKSGAAIATNNRALLAVDGYIVGHLMALEPTSAILSEWLYHLSCTWDMMDFADNTGYPSLKQSATAAIEIPLPPLAEQRRIVADLARKNAAAGRLETLARQQLADLAALPAALLREVFVGAI